MWLQGGDGAQTSTGLRAVHRSAQPYKALHTVQHIALHRRAENLEGVEFLTTIGCCSVTPVVNIWMLPEASGLPGEGYATPRNFRAETIR